MKFFIRAIIDGVAQKIVVLVDDQDAYLLRTKVWKARRTTNGPLEIYTHETSRSAQAQLTLGHAILGQAEGFYAIHVDGNPLNCRRENLKAIPRSEHLRRMREKSARVRGCA